MKKFQPHFSEAIRLRRKLDDARKVIASQEAQIAKLASNLKNAERIGADERLRGGIDTDRFLRASRRLRDHGISSDGLM